MPLPACFPQQCAMCFTGLCLVATIRADRSDLWLWLREALFLSHWSSFIPFCLQSQTVTLFVFFLSFFLSLALFLLSFLHFLFLPPSYSLCFILSCSFLLLCLSSLSCSLSHSFIITQLVYCPSGNQFAAGDIRQRQQKVKNNSNVLYIYNDNTNKENQVQLNAKFLGAGCWKRWYMNIWLKLWFTKNRIYNWELKCHTIIVGLKSYRTY